jgi:hypothetical protein
VRATENSHLTPQCPGIGEASWLARDRIVSQAMMGGGAFILLKGGRSRPKSAKQVEIRLAILLKILQIARSGDRVLSRAGQLVRRCICGDFRRIWLISLNDVFCYLDHSFSSEIGSESCEEMQGKDDKSISA